MNKMQVEQDTMNDMNLSSYQGRQRHRLKPSSTFNTDHDHELHILTTH